ncbi:hypothetical protein AL066_08980 [Pseudomonas nunensis]|nr:hypothetical protein AL066_08980 [Pseudomonas nunensis]
MSPDIKVSPMFLNYSTRSKLFYMLSPLALFSLGCSSAMARALAPGETAVVVNPSPAEAWSATQGGSLTILGGETSNISISGSSSLSLSGVTTNITTGLSALQVINSNATITESTLNTNGIAIRAGRTSRSTTGSVVTVTDSTVIGGTGGVLASSYSTLNFSNSRVESTGANSVGLSLLGASANINAGSTIVGVENGVSFSADPTDTQTSLLKLDNSTVQSTTGAAILVDVPPVAGAPVQIQLNNNSSLIGGNGAVLEVRNGSSADISVDRSNVFGDVLNDATSTTRVTLSNGASLVGRMENVTSATINSTALWDLPGDSQVGTLLMNGGTVKFGSDQAFYQLNVGSLSGNGVFQLGTDFATGQTDLLNVTGEASGDHQLAIASSGAEPASGQPITVVHTGGGDATFALTSGTVDLGAFSYGLAKSGNDWLLDPTTRVVSPGARSVLALFNTAIPVWYGDLAPLRSRMGELRLNPGSPGAWARVYGNKFNVADGSGVGYQQTQRGFSIGADALLPWGDQQWLIGLLAGHSDSDLDLSHGTSGTVDSYYFGTYLTWIDRQTGYFFDGVLKYNRYQNEAKVGLSDGKRAKGNYDSSGIGVEAEFGRHISLTSDYFIEPFARFSAVVIEGKDFDLDNEMTASGDQAKSFLGKVGMTVGRNFEFEKGMVAQPYVRAAFAHEFAENNEVKVNDTVFNNNLSGSRGEGAAGVALKMNDNLQVHADFEYSKGKNIEQPYGVTLGMRYAW